jgi:DNA invertase Pin-like site-specific DNA recombinase
MAVKNSKKPVVISYLRFSTGAQAKGDSIRRQLALSDAWAIERELTIDRRLDDGGRSGYTGSNLEPTADLGRLLELLKGGKIAKGTILLVENLDRLSRQDILPALRLFTTLVEGGLKVVTLCDGKEYDHASVTANPMDLMFSIMVLSRGHEESRIKSQRVCAAWRAKQKGAAQRPVTSMCPQWLRREANRWVFVPEAVAAIRTAAKMVCNNHSWKSIVKHLNANHPKCFGRKHTWTRSGLFSLMRKRMLIGEYQPHKRPANRKGSPIPLGEAVEDYYPAVLDAKSFRQVQKVIDDRKNSGGFRESETPNIWSARIFDLEDNVLYMSDHGSGKRYKSAGRINGTSDMPMVPLYEVDRGLVFGLLDYLKVNEVAPSADAEVLHVELGGIEHRLKKLSLELANMDSDPAIVVGAIDLLQMRKLDLIGRIARAETPPQSSEVAAVLSAAMSRIEDRETRRKLKTAIGAVVDKVHLYCIREYRDHVISACFHLCDGSELDWAFRICHQGPGKYSLEWSVAKDTAASE